MENKDVLKYTNLGVIASPLADEVKKALKRLNQFEHIWSEDKKSVVEVC